jgi:hypothetical protein
VSATERRDRDASANWPSTLARGSLVGLGAWLVALLVLGGVALAGDLPFTGAVPLWKGWAWYFLDAQFVPVVRTGGTRTVRLDLLAAVDSPLTPLARPTPPLVLAAAGALAVREGLFEDAPYAVGVALLPGYLVPTVAIAGLGAHTISVDLVVTTVRQTVAAEVGPALLAVAVGYPLVFGGLGGAALALVRSRRGDTE